VRIALPASGTGFILTPPRVLHRLTHVMRGKLGRVKARLGLHQTVDSRQS